MALMTDPVIGPDGHTYERAALATWLQTSTTSPITRQRMMTTTITPNFALRTAIKRWLEERGVTSVSVAAAGGDTSGGSAAKEGAESRYAFRPAPVEVAARRVMAEDGEEYLHLALAAPADGQRQPVTLIAIIDNSGSMGSPASMGQGGEAQEFSVLDLVKHATNTIAATLQEHDHLAIVTYSSSANRSSPNADE